MVVTFGLFCLCTSLAMKGWYFSEIKHNSLSSKEKITSLSRSKYTCFAGHCRCLHPWNQAMYLPSPNRIPVPSTDTPSPVTQKLNFRAAARSRKPRSPERSGGRAVGERRGKEGDGLKEAPICFQCLLVDTWLCSLNQTSTFFWYAWQLFFCFLDVDQGTWELTDSRFGLPTTGLLDYFKNPSTKKIPVIARKWFSASWDLFKTNKYFHLKSSYTWEPHLLLGLQKRLTLMLFSIHQKISPI